MRKACLWVSISLSEAHAVKKWRKSKKLNDLSAVLHGVGIHPGRISKVTIIAFTWYGNQVNRK